VKRAILDTPRVKLRSSNASLIEILEEDHHDTWKIFNLVESVNPATISSDNTMPRRTLQVGTRTEYGYFMTLTIKVKEK
jgi:hypothetical protein